MEKQTLTKIISRIIIFVFLVSVFLPISNTNAVSQTSLTNAYNNPNQTNTNDPSYRYKFKISDVINSSTLTSVIGCTGVVNKVAKFEASIIQTPLQQAKIYKDKIKRTVDQLKSACSSVKSAAETTAQLIPGVGGVSKGIDTTLAKVSGNPGALTMIGNMAKISSLSIKSPTTNTTGVTNTNTTAATSAAAKSDANKVKICQDAVDATSQPQLDELTKINEDDQDKTFKEQCFDGIAITLAKNQLTAMARSTMNWVASGYGGNPLFVQNMKNLTYNIEKNVVDTGIDILLAPKNASPYSADFAKTTLSNIGIVGSSSKFLGGLQSDLGNFISDPRSYYSDSQLNSAQDTRSALQRAQDANNAFSRDFASGGWGGWLALTQRPQNNSLGFNMIANQYLNDVESQVVSDQKAEITQNGGFMSQKVCKEWYKINPKDGGPMYDSTKDTDGESYDEVATTIQPTQAEMAAPGGCASYKTITPGSLIKDKVSDYLNSPDRQAELVKTINDGLNLLFSSLLSNFQSGGLTSLSDSSVNTSNWTDNMNNLNTNSTTGSSYDNGGAYDNFNLTRDLGNTYIHEPAINYGEWDAKNNWTTTVNKLNNNKKLYPSLNPELYQEVSTTVDGKTVTSVVPIITNNAYYTVTVPGKTKLINDGYNNWEVGDRAFWDGTAWQNWKKGQQSPIAKRGVIQIQQDYIVAATEAKNIISKIMPKLGELDYCIPGPNPSYKTNSTETQSAYQDWINSIYTGPQNNTDTNRMEWTIDRESSSTYKNFANIFADNTNVWNKITDSNFVAWFLNYFGPFTGTKNEGTSSYSWNDKEKSKYEEAEKLRKITTNYTNSSLFQNFYDVFDNMMNKVYFTTMNRPYNDTETSIGVDPNPSYIPMAQNGVDLVKDISYYNDDYNQKITDYETAIDQEKTNIAKLQPIRDEVSGIIKDAQKRRDDNLIAILKDEAIRTGGNVLTAAEYKKKYASCLSEENIQVFDADGILGRGTKEAENCTDGIDNDLNGLTDAQDPACKSYIQAQALKSNHCVQGALISGVYDGDSTPCSARTIDNCSSTYYSNNPGISYMCNWSTPATETQNPIPLQSVAGCMIDAGQAIKPTNGSQDNQNCLSRTNEASCTSDYYYTNNNRYTCKWRPSMVEVNN